MPLIYRSFPTNKYELITRSQPLKSFPKAFEGKEDRLGQYLQNDPCSLSITSPGAETLIISGLLTITL